VQKKENQNGELTEREKVKKARVKIEIEQKDKCEEIKRES
jgi:hypothetical protein